MGLRPIYTDISQHPILQMFLGHLVSFESKNRKKSDAREHMRRVCRLLYEVDSEGKDVKLVWANASLDTIRNNFFRGNDLLPKPRKAQTLKTYVVSFKLFLNFMLSRVEGITRIDSSVSSHELELVQAALTRIKHWTGSLTPVLTRRRAEVRQGTKRVFLVLTTSPECCRVQ